MKLPSPKSYAFWLALVRIYTGIFWIGHGAGKFVDGDAFMPPNGMIAGFIQKALTATSGPYHDFLANVVQPNIGLFAELVRLGEVLTGCALFFGLLTRLGALGGMFLALNYMAASAEFTSLSGWTGLDAIALAMSAINLVLPTGRFLGVDALQRTPKTVATPAPPIVQPASATAPNVSVQFVDEPEINGPTAPRD